MTALETLRSQHRDIMSLFKRITSGNGDRSQWVDELATKLRLHTRLEETIVYPAIERHGTKRGQEEILESYEEHRIVDYLMAQLPTMQTEDERFLARVRVLQSLVQEHIEEEETEVFKQAEALKEEELQEMGERIDEQMREVQQVDELLQRAAKVAERTERWAGSLLDAGLRIPRRAVRALAPTRWIRLDPRAAWAARIANTVPTVVVDSLYRTITGRGAGGAQGRRAA